MITLPDSINGSVPRRPLALMLPEDGVPVASVQKTTIRTFTVEGEEKNERLRPRIPWKQTPYIPDDSCRI